MTFFPLFKHNAWVTTLATHVAGDATWENALYNAASLMDAGIQNT
jgi:hypothetical protein